jgi:hypothetical protein
MEAWKARVGYSRESSLTQRAYVEVSVKFDIECPSICKWCVQNKNIRKETDVCPKTKQSFTLARAKRRLKIATQNRDRLSTLRRPGNKTLPDLGGRDINLPLL